MTNKGLLLWLALSVLVSPVTLLAEPLEDVPELWCAVIESFECAAGSECKRGLPDAINFPRIIKIDFINKIIVDDQFGEAVRTTAIDSLQEFDGMLILHGIQQEFGWAMVINRSNGDLTLNATSDGFGFTIFGACTPR